VTTGADDRHMTDGSSPTGVLVLRVWTEDGDSNLKARITTTINIEAPEMHCRAVAGAGPIIAAINSFLEDYSRYRAAGDSVTPW
jgi:hypothetical protein